MSEESLEALARRFGAVMTAGDWMVTTAESCTGGAIAKTITDVAGSSAWLDRGFVTYTNDAKHHMLAVPEATLDAHGAVSSATVEAMVTGALTHSAANLAVAVSGVAGPAGGTADKPVGLIWFAWARRGHPPEAQVKQLDGDRGAVRGAAVRVALNGLIELAEEAPL